MIAYHRLPALILLLLSSSLFSSFAQRISVAQDNSITDEKHLQDAKNPDNLSYPGITLRNGIRNLAKHHETALVADPHSVPNHVGLAEAQVMYWCFGFAPRDEVLHQIKSSAHQAVKHDPNSAAAHTALGIAKLSDWDWTGAEEEFKIAIELEPNRAGSHHWYALFLAASGRHEEALAESKKAVAADPSPGMQTGLAAVRYFGRDWQGMIVQLQKTIKDHPNFAPAHDWLGMAYVQEKQYDNSITTYERAVKQSEGLAEIYAGLGHAYGLAGQEDKARVVLKKLQQLDERWYVPPVQIAYVHVSLGEHDEAFRMLERAYQEHSWELVFLKVEPWFDVLRDDPRFKQLESKLNFP